MAYNAIVAFMASNAISKLTRDVAESRPRRCSEQPLRALRQVSPGRSSCRACVFRRALNDPQHLGLLRAILRRCVRDWEWLDRAPAVRLLKEPTRRIRFLTHDQAAALLKELPSHLRDMATLTLATGLRAANVTG